MRKGVFLSYHPTDEQWANHLKVHLNARQSELDIQIWDKTNIQIGDEVATTKNQILQKIKVVIILLSAPYLAAEEQQEEARQLLQLAENDGVVIFPIYANHCKLSEDNPLIKYLPLEASVSPLVNKDAGSLDKFFVYVGDRIKIAMKFEEVAEEIADWTEKEKITTDLKKDIKKNIQQLENPFIPEDAEQRNKLRLSLAKICVISILKRVTPEQNPNGLRMKIINERSKTQWRKYIFQSLDELEKWGYVEKIRLGKETYWKLSGKGLDFSQEIDSSFLFDEHA